MRGHTRTHTHAREGCRSLHIRRPRSARALLRPLQARDRFQTITSNHYGPRSSIKNFNGGGNCPMPWENYGSTAMVAVDNAPRKPKAKQLTGKPTERPGTMVALR